MKTLLLNPDSWDLMLDASGNIALASEPYALAQDVASAARLFLGELYYDVSKGVPYFQEILGRSPPLELIRANYVEAALTVPGVLQAKCTITRFQNRKIEGEIDFLDATGIANKASL